MPQPSLHRILIDEEWSLVDLYEFPHTYTHAYAFLYSLTQTGRLSEPVVAEIYRRHPWRGGYSAVNFYGELYYAMGEEHRPMVNSMRYASPGYIEIRAVAAVSKLIETTVKSLAKCVDIADATYDRIHKRAQKRKLLSLDVKRQVREFEREDIQFMVESSKELSKLLQFGGLEQLQARTKNELATLKILLSFYRRARNLVTFYQSRKVRFDADSHHKIEDKS